MDRTATNTSFEQLHMDGIPMPVRPSPNAAFHNVFPGQSVMYVGNVAGGPKFGSRGFVKKALPRKIIADMGHSGIWHIPYYFLTVPLKAG